MFRRLTSIKCYGDCNIMANPEHLKILKQGVEAWNKCRHEKPDVRPNLGGADLSGMDLRGIHLALSHLHKAVVTKANLGEADLCSANLSFADLSKAVLTKAMIGFANLMGAKLVEADLEDASLAFSLLTACNLTRARLTGLHLYGTARDNWIIKDVECKYVNWDFERKHRSPKDRDLEPGEFERLYAELPTIEYIFEKGMSPIDPLIMDRVVQAIREKQPGFDIKIDSINARGLAPSIKFTVQHDEHKESALEEVRNGYETKIRQLETERDRYWSEIQRALDKPSEVKLITAGPGAIVATDGSAVNIQQHVHNAIELQKAIADEPEESESFANVAKKTALDIVGGAIKDIAKGQVKEAAAQIIELGKDLGPLFVRMAPLAYEFFSNIGT